MSDKPKNPAEWVDSIGLRGAVTHLAELVYTVLVPEEEKPWEETPDKITKPEGYELPDGYEGNLDPSSWQVTRMPEDQKKWQIVDAKNMKIAHKFPDRETAIEYIDWGRANRKSLTAKPNTNAKKE